MAAGIPPAPILGGLGGLGLRILGLGFRVSGFSTLGLGFRVWDLGSRI